MLLKLSTPSDSIQRSAFDVIYNEIPRASRGRFSRSHVILMECDWGAGHFLAQTRLTIRCVVTVYARNNLFAFRQNNTVLQLNMTINECTKRQHTIKLHNHKQRMTSHRKKYEMLTWWGNLCMVQHQFHTQHSSAQWMVDDGARQKPSSGARTLYQVASPITGWRKHAISLLEHRAEQLSV
jgi:hypothetical protein